MSSFDFGGHVTDNQKVLRSVAEDLKVPLLRILTEAQLDIDDHMVDRAYIETTAQAALRLLDSYIITTQIYSGQQQLDVEPVSVLAVMNDTAQYLDRLAKLYDCRIEIKARKNTQLVMANADALQAAFTSLGYSFLNAIIPRSRQKNVLVLSAHNDNGQVQAGIFSPHFRLSAQQLGRARHLVGSAQVAIPAIMRGSNAGVVIADTLFEAMNYRLAVGRRLNLSGLTIKLTPSYQMSLL